MSALARVPLLLTFPWAQIRLLQSVFDAMYRNVIDSTHLVERAQRLARKYNRGQVEEDKCVFRVR